MLLIAASVSLNLSFGISLTIALEYLSYLDHLLWEIDENTERSSKGYIELKKAHLKFLIFFVYLDTKTNCTPNKNKPKSVVISLQSCW